jgi:SAM-dependent methyltransferase
MGFGLDVLIKSLENCQKNANQIDVKNLRLIEENINGTTHINEFNYIISTGVVHNNFDTNAPLKCLHRALKQGGIIELMVYNY